MGIVILGVIFALVGGGCLVASRFARDPGDKRIGVGAGSVALLLAVVVPVLGAVTTVTANTVGVVTSFGRYQGVVQSGLHMLPPWTDVEEFGTRIQPLQLENVPMRFAGNSGGDADLLIEWRLLGADEPAVRQLWSDYRTFQAVEDRLVRANAIDAMNVILAQYDPSAGVNGGNRQTIRDKALTVIKERLAGTGVQVDRLTIIHIAPDQGSQRRIDQQVQAEADQTTARTQAETATIRARSDAAGDKQLECLRLVETWDVARQGPIPAAWNCNFGGPQPPVLVGPSVR